MSQWLKTTGYCCKEPEFASQNPHGDPQTLAIPQFEEVQCPLLGSMVSCIHMVHKICKQTLIHTKNCKNKIKNS